TITEGSTIMKFPSDDESAVFYNPVQVQNRDLSILMIALYAERRAIRRAVQLKKKELNKQKQTNKDITKEEIQNQLKSGNTNSNIINGDGITILDALAASGLRSIRYWKEIPGVKHVTINDLEAAAVERAKDNVRNNSLESMLTTTPLPTKQQQQCPMWDVIDLDPYGSAAPFLDGAVQSVENGGLLCITCTDMAALGGSHPETAYGRYGSLPIQSAKYLQELALRILLYTISISAAKYGRTIKPILSVGMNFYVRVFVEVYNDKRGVSDLCLKMGNVYQSTQCSSFITVPHGQKGGKNGNGYQSTRVNPSICPETGAQFKVGGPLWLGPLHDQSVVSVALKRLASGGGGSSSNTTTSSNEISPNMNLIATRSRLEGLLTSVSEELDNPLYYTLPGLCLVLKCTSPPMKTFKAAIVNAGYKVSGYHKEPGAIKTDAPGHVIWDIMRAWVDKNPLKKKPAEGSATFKILAMERKLTDVDFTAPKKSSWTKKGEKKITRFPQNPEKNWGPK
ncbi:N2,N2-dimethylguanosine tRNA methyltransferase, partial [Fragilariopsis cylindrus CCMP1102]